MTTLCEAADVSVIALAVVEKADEITRFLEPDCPALIWRRRSSNNLQAWLEELPEEQLPQGRLILRTETIGDAVRQLCENAHMPDCVERELLIADIVELGESFAELINVRHLRLRLDRVSNNACRKFHVDAISARLVCTYRGTGTQYGISAGDNEPQHVSTVSTGEPILLRGSLWPESPRSGLLHRSPPIEGTGETRLVLVLDPIADPEDEM